MPKIFLCFIVLFFYLNSFSQEKLEGKYIKQTKTFIPNDKSFGVVEMPNDSFGVILKYDKEGLINKHGKILLPIKYVGIRLFENNTDYVITTDKRKSNRTNNNTHHLRPLNDLAKSQKLDFYSSSDWISEKYVVTVNSKNEYFIFDLHKKKNIFGPHKFPIQTVEPYGFLIGATCSEKQARLNFTRMGEDPTVCFSYYDSNLVKKTDYNIKRIEYEDRSKLFRTMNNNGKGKLDQDGNELFPPNYDHIGHPWRTKDFFEVKFNGLKDIRGHDIDGFAATEGSDVQLYKRKGPLVISDTLKRVNGYYSSDSVFIVTPTGYRTVFVPDINDSIIPSGLVTYIKGGKENLLQENGQYVFRNNFKNISFIKPGYFFLQTGRQNLIYNHRKRKIIPTTLDSKKLKPTRGFILYKDGNKTGLVTPNGNIWQDKMFDNISISEGFALTNDNDALSLIDPNFKTIVAKGSYDYMKVKERERKKYIIVGKKNLKGVMLYGALTIKGQAHLPLKYEEVDYTHDEGFPFVVKQNGKYGLFNKNLKLVVPCIHTKKPFNNDNFNWLGVYDNRLTINMDSTGKVLEHHGYFVQWTGREMFPFLKRRDGSFNFLDENGELVFQEKTKYLKEVLNKEVFFGERRNRQGMINYRGKIIIPFENDTLYKVYGLGVVAKKNNKTFIYKMNGDLIKTPLFDTLNTRTWQGNFAFGNNGKWGIMNANGDVLIPAVYESIRPWVDHFVVKDKKKHFIINSNNKKVTIPSDNRYNRMQEFTHTLQDSCLIIYTKDFKRIKLGCYQRIWHRSTFGYELWGKKNIIFLDSAGNKRHKGFFTARSGNIYGDHIIVVQDGKKILINKKFETLAKGYDDIQIIEKNKYKVQKNNYWGIINAKGKLITKIEYVDISKYSSKKVRVKNMDNKIFYLDEKGQKLQ